MDSCSIHHTPEGLLVEANNRSVLIGEKDLPLIRRGMARPLRSMNHESLGRGNYCFTRNGNLVIHQSTDELSIPSRVWLDRSGIRRVFLSSPLPGVTA